MKILLEPVPGNIVVLLDWFHFKKRFSKVNFAQRLKWSYISVILIN